MLLPTLPAAQQRAQPRQRPPDRPGRVRSRHHGQPKSAKPEMSSLASIFPPYYWLLG